MREKKPFMVEFTGTPEAGKTTAIKVVSNMLENAGHSVMILEESAEKLPKEIPKGTFDANLWMHFITQAGVLKATYSQAEIVLIDRGIIDSKFYAWKFFHENEASVKEYEYFKKTCLSEVNPDLLLGLIVSPSTALKRRGRRTARRGAEGKIVKEEYIKKYNKYFCDFFNDTTLRKSLIRTDELQISEMNELIYKIISDAL